VHVERDLVISDSVLTRSRAAVCAIGYLKVPIEQYQEEGGKASHLHIEGTGFLVRENVVLTNGHVLRDLKGLIEEAKWPPDRLCVLFDQTSARLISTFGKNGILINRSFDVGLVEIAHNDNATPVKLRETLGVHVGQHVGTLGYAYGSSLLLRDDGMGAERAYRSGPILQQGYVSALAPFPDADRVERILLDMRTSRGMSGAPVFSAEDGVVIGLHQAGLGIVTAFAVSLTIPFVNQLCHTWLDAANGKPTAHIKLQAPVRNTPRTS
jgi:hypothetical protein